MSQEQVKVRDVSLLGKKGVSRYGRVVDESVAGTEGNESAQ